MVGWLSPLWETMQAVFWLDCNSSISPQHWARGPCQCLVQATHAIWLFQNQHVQSQLLKVQTRDILEAIWHEFDLDHQDLLPADHSYLTMASGTDGFSLQDMLDLPLPDQQLWLHTLQQARAQGSHILTQEVAWMHLAFLLGSNPTLLVPPNLILAQQLHFGFASSGGQLFVLSVAHWHDSILPIRH